MACRLLATGEEAAVPITDQAVIEGDQAVVGDVGAMGIGTQVLEHLRGSPKGRLEHITQPFRHRWPRRRHQIFGAKATR